MQGESLSEDGALDVEKYSSLQPPQNSLWTTLGVKDSKALLRAWIGKSRIENVTFIHEVEEKAQQISFRVSWRKVLDAEFPLSVVNSDVGLGVENELPNKQISAKGKKEPSALAKIEATHSLLKEYVDGGKLDIDVIAPICDKDPSRSSQVANLEQDGENSDMDIQQGTVSEHSHIRPSVIPKLDDATVAKLDLSPIDSDLQLATRQPIWILLELVEAVQPDPNPNPSCEAAQTDKAVGVELFKFLTTTSPFKLPVEFDTRVYKRDQYYYVSMSWAVRAIPYALSRCWPHWQQSNVDNDVKVLCGYMPMLTDFPKGLYQLCQIACNHQPSIEDFKNYDGPPPPGVGSATETVLISRRGPEIAPVSGVPGRSAIIGLYIALLNFKQPPPYTGPAKEPTLSQDGQDDNHDAVELSLEDFGYAWLLKEFFDEPIVKRVRALTRTNSYLIFPEMYELGSLEPEKIMPRWDDAKKNQIIEVMDDLSGEVFRAYNPTRPGKKRFPMARDLAKLLDKAPNFVTDIANFMEEVAVFRGKDKLFQQHKGTGSLVENIIKKNRDDLDHWIKHGMPKARKEPKRDNSGRGDYRRTVGRKPTKNDDGDDISDSGEPQIKYGVSGWLKFMREKAAVTESLLQTSSST